MARARIKYLRSIDGQLHYRRRVPRDIQGSIGKSEWVHSLGLADGQEIYAARIVSDYNLAYCSLIAQERVKRVVTTPVFPLVQAGVQAGIQAAPQPTPEVIKEPETPKILLSEAYQYDRQAYGGNRNEKVFQVAVDSVITLIGDVDIMAMTPKDVQIWISKCTDIGQKTSTVQRRINALRALINRYFKDHEIEKRNPFSKPNIKDAGGSSTDRLPFNRDHLKRIDHYFKNNDRIKDESRHIVALLKYTGARPLEIGGLDASDIILNHAVSHIWIRTNRHRGIKTKGSDRRVPLIGDAYEAALKIMETNPKGAVFSRPCHDTNSLSQRLNKFIRAAGVPKSPRLVTYSFRHTLEEAMRSAGIREHTQRRIMGHTDTSMTGRYGAPAGMLEELQEALRKAEPLLGRVDKSIYSADEI